MKNYFCDKRTKFTYGNKFFENEFPVSRQLYMVPFFLIWLISSCGVHDCNNLPIVFESYTEAITIIESSHFEIQETYATEESSWITSIAFYSCDGETGFLIMETNGLEYVHSEVPIDVWEELKISGSTGNFYNSNLRGKYQMEIKTN